jgi:hypothetical protein
MKPTDVIFNMAAPPPGETFGPALFFDDIKPGMQVRAEAKSKAIPHTYQGRVLSTHIERDGRDRTKVLTFVGGMQINLHYVTVKEVKL